MSRQSAALAIKSSDGIHPNYFAGKIFWRNPLRKSTNRASKRVKQSPNDNRNREFYSEVAPVAEREGDSPNIMIPATLEEHSNSTDAVITVEVKRPGKPLRKRAAVIPIAVRHRTRVNRQSEPKPEIRQRESHRPEGSAPENRWSDPLTDSLVTATQILEAAIILANHMGATMIDLASNLARIVLSGVAAPAGEERYVFRGESTGTAERKELAA
jgi:hypothetical protein